MKQQTQEDRTMTGDITFKLETKTVLLNSGYEMPMNTLAAYQGGKQVYKGTDHGNEFFDSEKKMRLLFLDFANL